MHEKRFAVGCALCLLIFAGGVAVSAQTVDVSATAEQAGSWIDQALTFIDSAATYLGQGVIYVINLVVGTDPDTGLGRVPSNLQKPIGYLALITLILLLFGLLDTAKRIIWIGIIVGWALLIVRIILEALNL